jgi:solute carrier family 13 (sodium-dependent dicarboxylate transporter), member 2/3/5
MSPDTNVMLHPVEGRTLQKTLVLCGISGVLALIAFWLAPADLPLLGRRTVAIFVLAASLWATEAIPLYATSLSIIGLEILLLAHHGGLASTGDLRYTQFLSPFSSGIIILFMGGFLLARAATKHQIDTVIASRILSPFVTSPLRLIYAVLGITAIFSMWMSNTATTAMMLAIVAPILHRLPAHDRFHRAIILAVPFGANIGGIGTPIGTPPNAVALANLHQAGIHIGFLDWMTMGIPLCLLLLFITGGLLYVSFRPTAPLQLEPVPSPGPLSLHGRLTLLILLGAIVMWLTSQWHGIAEAVVALLAAALLTALRALERRDVDSIDWNILILMWGGLSLGNAVQLTGVTEWITSIPIDHLSGFGLATAVVVIAITLSTFMSNTAAANLIIPMALVLSVGHPAQLVLLTAFACSFAMALPVSTPPNAIAFATGRIPASSMLRVGVLVSIVATIVLLLGYQALLPLVMH